MRVIVTDYGDSLIVFYYGFEDRVVYYNFKFNKLTESKSIVSIDMHTLHDYGTILLDCYLEVEGEDFDAKKYSEDNFPEYRI